METTENVKIKYKKISSKKHAKKVHPHIPYFELGPSTFNQFKFIQIYPMQIYPSYPLKM